MISGIGYMIPGIGHTIPCIGFTILGIGIGYCGYWLYWYWVLDISNILKWLRCEDGIGETEMLSCIGETVGVERQLATGGFDLIWFLLADIIYDTSTKQVGSPPPRKIMSLLFITKVNQFPSPSLPLGDWIQGDINARMNMIQILTEIDWLVLLWGDWPVQLHHDDRVARKNLWQMVLKHPTICGTGLKHSHS